MATFEDFLRKMRQRGADENVEKHSDLLPLISTALLPALKSKLITQEDAEAFEQKVVELVQSDEFIHEISDTMGEPMPNESEEEFVNRGEDVMRSLLESKFIR